MRLDVSVDIPFAREQVFKTYRDDLPKLVRYLENVRAITVTSRTEEGPLVKLVNRWRGGGEIPARDNPACLGHAILRCGVVSRNRESDAASAALGQGHGGIDRGMG